MKFKSLEDQLYLIKRGVDEILPEDQLIKMLGPTVKLEEELAAAKQELIDQKLEHNIGKTPDRVPTKQ